MKSLVAGLCFGLIFLVADALAGQAIDCSKALSDIDRAICADTDTRAADNIMSEVYSSLHKKLGKAGRAVLQRSQRNWLSYRNSTCGPVASCLKSENEAQANTLRNLRPGMVPVIIWQKSAKNRAEVRIDGETFANPKTRGEVKFNAVIDRIIAKSPLGKKVNDGGSGNWDHHIVLTLSLANSEFLSLTVAHSDFSGGAHPNSWSVAYNINRKTGAQPKASDIFLTKGLKSLVLACQHQVVKAKDNIYQSGDRKVSVRELEANYPGEVAKHIGDLARWGFDEKGASVMFDSYAIGPYVEGPFVCEFSKSLLKPMMKQPGTVWP